jgi:SAM-dependent methyltransferase
MEVSIPSPKVGNTSTTVRWLTQRFYPNPGILDHSFRDEILSRIDSTSVVLDYGAGRGRSRIVDFRSIAGTVHGVDVDPAVFENPLLDEARLLEGATIPYDDATFDVVYALWVLEHLEDPCTTFAEIRRVLKPGGVFVARTPNLHHYVPLIARYTPHAFHVWTAQLTSSRHEGDVFPTFYRANSERRARRLAGAAGLRVEKIVLRECMPRRLRFHALPYVMGIAYERTVNRLEVLRHFRGDLVAVLGKPEA